jgi:hypothetical protein
MCRIYSSQCEVHALGLSPSLQGLTPYILLIDGGSADPEKNNMLSAALKKARTIGVPKDTIEAALSRVRPESSDFFKLSQTA